MENPAHDTPQAEVLRLQQQVELYEGRLKKAQEAMQVMVQIIEAFKFSSLHLTASMALENVLESLLQLALNLIKADDAHIYLYTHNRLRFGARLEGGRSYQTGGMAPGRYQLGERVARSGQRIVIPDTQADPGLQESQPGAYVGMPLRMGAAVVGVMNFGFNHPQAFSERELDLLDLFGSQAAIAIENARLYKESEAKREQERRYLEELNRTKDMLVGTVSHDLKNPISIIKGYVHVLRELGAGDSDLGKTALYYIEHGADRMLSLVTDLLDLARLETGLAIKREVHDLNKLLQECWHDYLPMAEQKQIQLHFHPLPAPEWISVDPKRLLQVLNNLVSNAIKYTPEGGLVTLTIEQEEDAVLVNIQDTGLGIPEADLPHLFEKFYRIKNTKHEQSEGTGLGLAIVKEIVEQHQGQIYVKSRLGEGSLFQIRLPLT